MNPAVKKRIVSLINGTSILRRLYRIYVRVFQVLIHTPPAQMVVGTVRTLKFVGTLNGAGPDFRTWVFRCDPAAPMERNFLLAARRSVIAAGGRPLRCLCLAAGTAEVPGLPDFYALGALCPGAVHFRLAWDEAKVRDFCSRFLSATERERVLPLLAAPAGEETDIRAEDIRSLFARTGGRVFACPHVCTVRARELLKGFGSGTIAMALGVPDFPASDDGAAARDAWFDAFAGLRVRLPRLRFVVTGETGPWRCDGSPFGPEFTFLRATGRSLPDEAAVVQQCDAYAGPLGVCGVIAADAGLPMLIVADGGELPSRTEIDGLRRGLAPVVLDSVPLGHGLDELTRILEDALVFLPPDLPGVAT